MQLINMATIMMKSNMFYPVYSFKLFGIIKQNVVFSSHKSTLHQHHMTNMTWFVHTSFIALFI